MPHQSAKSYPAILRRGRPKRAKYLQANLHLSKDTHVVEDSLHQENRQVCESKDGKLLPPLKNDNLAQPFVSGGETSDLVKQAEESKILLLASDVQKLENYLSSEMEKVCTNLAKDPCCSDYYQLSVLTAAKIILFNKPRANKAMQLTVASFKDKSTKLDPLDETVQCLSSVEKKLCERLDVVKTLDKDEKTMPILLTSSTKKAVDLLVDKRSQVNIPPDNPYIFAKLIDRVISSMKVLHTVTENVRLENPGLLQDARLQKHVAFISQILAMQDNELDWLSSHFANLVAAEVDSCSPQISAQELTQVVQLLHGMGCGQPQHNTDQFLSQIKTSDEKLIPPKCLLKEKSPARKLVVNLCDISKYLVKMGQDLKDITEGSSVGLKHTPDGIQKVYAGDKPPVRRSYRKCRPKQPAWDNSFVTRSSRKLMQKVHAGDKLSVSRSSTCASPLACKVSRVPLKKRSVCKAPKTLPAGLLLTDGNDSWMLGSSIGRSGFGEIYRATFKSKAESHFSMKEFESHLIKVELKRKDDLFYQLELYQRATKPRNIDKWKDEHRVKYLAIPKHVACGQYEHNKIMYNFVILEKIGKDLDYKLRLRNHQLEPHLAYSIALQLVSAVEYLHSYGFVHADIKPASIVMRQGPVREGFNRVVLVDFGVAPVCKKNGFSKKISGVMKKSHECTLEYASRDAHSGVLPTKRGDIETLAYNLVHWLSGKLPWKGVEDKDEVSHLKTVNMNKIHYFLSHCFGEGIYAPQLYLLLKYVSTLGYEETPDYSHVRRLLKKANRYHKRLIPQFIPQLIPQAACKKEKERSKMKMKKEKRSQKNKKRKASKMKRRVLAPKGGFLSSGASDVPVNPPSQKIPNQCASTSLPAQPGPSKRVFILPPKSDQPGLVIVTSPVSTTLPAHPGPSKGIVAKPRLKRKSNSDGNLILRKCSKTVEDSKESFSPMQKATEPRSNILLVQQNDKVLQQPVTYAIVLPQVPPSEQPKVNSTYLGLPGANEGNGNRTTGGIQSHKDSTCWSTDGIQSNKDNTSGSTDGILSNKDNTSGSLGGTLSNNVVTSRSNDGILSNKDSTSGSNDGILSNNSVASCSSDGILSNKDNISGSNDGILSNNSVASWSTDGILSNKDNTNLATDGSLSNKISTSGETNREHSAQIGDLTVQIKTEPVQIKIELDDLEYREKEMKSGREIVQETWTVVVKDAVSCDNVKPDPDVENGEGVSGQGVDQSEKTHKRSTSPETDGVSCDDVKPEPESDNDKRCTSLETDQEVMESISANQNMDAYTSSEYRVAHSNDPTSWNMNLDFGRNDPMPAAGHACMFCGVLLSEMWDHLITTHRNEKQIQEALSTQQALEQKAEIEDLKLYGDHCHNIQVLQSRKGTLIVLKQDQCKGKRQASPSLEDYLPCPECLGYAFYGDFLSHRMHCDAFYARMRLFCEKSHVKERNTQAMKNKAVITFVNTGISGAKVMRNIFILMLSDALKLEKDFEKMKCYNESMMNAVCVETVSSVTCNTSEMWQLLEVVRQGDACGSPIFLPEKVDALFRLIKWLYDQSMLKDRLHSHENEIRYLAMVIRNVLTSCAMKLKCKASAARDSDILSRVEQLISMFGSMARNDRIDIAAIPKNLLNLQRNNASEEKKTVNHSVKADVAEIQSLVAHVQKLENYLNPEVEKNYEQLGKRPDRTGYLGLSLATAAKIVLLNKPRANEAMQLRVQSYFAESSNYHPQDNTSECLTAVEKTLCERLHVVKIPNEEGQMVPILLTPKIKNAVELLLTKRRVVNIHPNNPYIFAKWDHLMDGMKAISVLRLIAMNGRLDIDCLQDARLQKHVATISQIMAMQDNELDWLKSHIANSLTGDIDVQNVQSSPLEMAKVIQLLCGNDSEETQVPVADSCQVAYASNCQMPDGSNGQVSCDRNCSAPDFSNCQMPDFNNCPEPVDRKYQVPDCNSSQVPDSRLAAQSHLPQHNVGNKCQFTEESVTNLMEPGIVNTDVHSKADVTSSAVHAVDPSEVKYSDFLQEANIPIIEDAEELSEEKYPNILRCTSTDISSIADNDQGQRDGEEASEIKISVNITNIMEDSIEEPQEEKYSDVLRRTGLLTSPTNVQDVSDISSCVGKDEVKIEKDAN